MRVRRRRGCRRVRLVVRQTSGARRPVVLRREESVRSNAPGQDAVQRAAGVRRRVRQVARRDAKIVFFLERRRTVRGVAELL